MITSFRNPLIKRIRQLRQKKVRLREGVGFLEGIRAVLTAVEAVPEQIESLVYAPDLLTSEVARKMLQAAAAEGVDTIPISAEIFNGISGRDNPTGLAAVIRSPLRRLVDLEVSPNSLFVALEAIADPGNLGTILRLLDAVGAAGCILVGQTTDLTHPNALKASMGSAFTVPVAAVERPEQLVEWASAQGLQRVATSARADESYWTAAYHFPVLIMMGSEQQGLSPGLREAADLSVVIPMWGQPTSLNLAVATGLVLYEVRRRSGLP